MDSRQVLSIAAVAAFVFGVASSAKAQCLECDRPADCVECGTANNPPPGEKCHDHCDEYHGPGYDICDSWGKECEAEPERVGDLSIDGSKLAPEIDWAAQGAVETNGGVGEHRDVIVVDGSASSRGSLLLDCRGFIIGREYSLAEQSALRGRSAVFRI